MSKLLHSRPARVSSPCPRLHRSGFRSQFQGWAHFYAKHFAIRLDEGQFRFPRARKGFERLVIVPAGLTIFQVISVLELRFPVELDHKMKDSNISSDRTQEIGYAILTRYWNQHGNTFRSWSANRLRRKGVPCLTLLEQLLIEMKHYAEAGKHFGNTIALCAGSRLDSGEVPAVLWQTMQKDPELQIFTVSPRDHQEFMSAREVLTT